jgi:hypothetical protein
MGVGSTPRSNEMGERQRVRRCGSTAHVCTRPVSVGVAMAEAKFAGSVTPRTRRFPTTRALIRLCAGATRLSPLSSERCKTLQIPCRFIHSRGL